MQNSWPIYVTDRAIRTSYGAFAFYNSNSFLNKNWAPDIDTDTEIVRLFETFISRQRNIKMLRPETLRGYHYVFETLLKLMPEIKAVKDINPGNISEFFKVLQTRERKVGKRQIRVGVKNSTVFTYRQKLSLFFDSLVMGGYMEENPFRRMPKVPQPIYNDNRALTLDETKRILTAIISHPDKNPVAQKRNVLMFYLLLFCGLRKTELRLLEVRDVDLEKRILTVRGETSKSKRTKEIPIHPTVSIYLKEYLSERNRSKIGYKTPFLLVSSLGDKGLSEGGLKHWTERLEKLSGVDFHLHKLRHTFATNLARQNTNIAKIQKLMGHTDIKMTQKYLRSLGVEDLRSDVDSLSIDGMS